jgi:hypothetical protein
LRPCILSSSSPPPQVSAPSLDYRHPIIPSSLVLRVYPFPATSEWKTAFSVSRDKEEVFSIPAVGEVDRKIQFRTGLSKLCLDFSFLLLRATLRTFSIGEICQYFADEGVSRTQRGGSPTAVISISRRGWVDTVPEPLLLRKCCSADLWICSQEL